MTRKGEFVLRQLAVEYILIPYGTTTEKMNRVLTLSETAAFIYEQTGDAASEEEIARRLGEAYDVPSLHSLTFFFPMVGKAIIPEHFKMTIPYTCLSV